MRGQAGRICLRLRAPKDKGAGVVIQPRQSLMNQSGPTDFTMCAGLTGSNRQGGIEQQNTLIRPVMQVGSVSALACIALDFLEDIAKARQISGECRIDGKGQPIGLVRRVIGVLPENYNAGGARLATFEGRECQRGPR